MKTRAQSKVDDQYENDQDKTTKKKTQERRQVEINTAVASRTREKRNERRHRKRHARRQAKREIQRHLWEQQQQEMTLQNPVFDIHLVQQTQQMNDYFTFSVAEYNAKACQDSDGNISIADLYPLSSHASDDDSS